MTKLLKGTALIAVVFASSVGVFQMGQNAGLPPPLTALAVFALTGVIGRAFKPWLMAR
mgnify:CR=1 FL=1